MIDQKVGNVHEIWTAQEQREKKRQNCNAKETCKHCNGVFTCVPIAEYWLQLTGCCKAGFNMECCLTVCMKFYNTEQE